MTEKPGDYDPDSVLEGRCGDGSWLSACHKFSIKLEGAATYADQNDDAIASIKTATAQAHATAEALNACAQRRPECPATATCANSLSVMTQHCNLGPARRGDALGLITVD